MPAAQPLPDPLADLRPNYVERLRARVGALSEFLADARVGKLPEPAITENHRNVHSMVSSAAIFGHPELSRAARNAERAFEQRGDAGNDLLIDQLAALLAAASDVLDVYQKPSARESSPDN